MVARKSVYLSDDSLRVVGREVSSLSGRINSIILRYGGMLREATPPLTVAEWSAICDVLNGAHLLADAGSDSVRFMWAEISDADRLNGLGAKWCIDAQDLAARLREMSYATQVAVAEVATHFWASEQLNELATEDLLRESGAVFADA
jgi:predicted SAM-dependent methyltransferase